MNSMDEIYHIRDNFIIVGLTGKYQSGCSMVAEMLSKNAGIALHDLDVYAKNLVQTYKKEKKGFKKNTYYDNTNNSNSDDKRSAATNDNYKLAYLARKYDIVNKFAQDNFNPFEILEIDKLIVFHAVYNYNLEKTAELKKQIEDGESKLKKQQSKDKSVKNKIKIDISKIKKEEEFKSKSIRIEEKLKKYYDALKFYFACFEEDKKFKENVDKLAEEYINFSNIITKLLKDIASIVNDRYELEMLLEEWACQLRAKGVIYVYNVYRAYYQKDRVSDKNAEVKGNTANTLANTINRFIKILHRRHTAESTRVVIDKLINPLEILYLRERYSTFFLVAINSDENTSYRRKTLSVIENDMVNGPVTREDKENIELNSSELIWGVLRTNINECITLADIQINNDGTYNDLAQKILYYSALMLHPGLVQPFPEERIMQIAYTVSMSSGCLSRQVGAVVTNDDYSVLSVGWNSAPKGQLPCTMRDLSGLKDNDYIFYDYYSHYETSDEGFCNHCKLLTQKYDEYTKNRDLRGLPLQYCFKDIFTTYSGKDEGNQVHTRSLHAEENAFLQLAKYGSTGIKNGLLFTTDQCCVLCAKKAYQLGIRKIYYIDPYKDIAPSHILRCPDIDVANIPQLTHFEGAVGPAYSKLYVPFFSQKDEICCRLGVNMKDESRIISNPKDPDTKGSEDQGSRQVDNEEKLIEGE